MIKKNFLSKVIIGGFVGGVILLVATWETGYWPTLWAWIVSGWKLLMGSLLHSVTMPRWGILVVVLSTIFITSIVKTIFFKTKNDGKSYRESEIKESEKKLKYLEKNIVKLLAQMDGDWLNLIEISTKLNTPRLLVERALENLLKADYIVDSHNGVNGTLYRLSSFGRDTAIDWGEVG